MATLNPGDEVIIPAPYWVSYPDMVLLAGGKPKIVKCSEKNEFKITPNELKKAIGKKTKWLIINSPSNPTGSCYTKNEIEELSKILIKNIKIYYLLSMIFNLDITLLKKHYITGIQLMIKIINYYMKV